MKLICPNCDAQYVVDDDVIPDEGRDVQCSNCGSTWFQQSARALAEAAAAFEAEERRQAQTTQIMPQPVVEEEQEPEGLDEAVAAPRPRRAIDDAVLEVLREEAEREKAARAGTTPKPAPVVGPAPSEMAPEEPIQQEAPRDVGPVPRPVHRSTDLEDEMPEAAAAGDVIDAVAVPDPSARRDRLPDIEAINSTLRASADPSRADVPEEANAELTVQAKRRSGFRVGFGGSLFVAAIALVVYIHAPRISAAVPGLTQPLETYVSAVDRGRLWLDESLSGFTGGSS